MSQLPPLDLNIIDTDWLAIPSQGSASKFSQMSPLQAYTSRHGSVNRHASVINLELPPSSQSPGSCRLAPHFGQSSSPAAKLDYHYNDEGAEFVALQEDEFDAIPALGLTFDGDGNLVEAVEEEPELPPFFGDMPSNVSMPASGAQQPLDDFLMMAEDQLLPDAEAFPATATAAPQRKEQVVAPSEENETVTTSEVVQATAPAKRRRTVKHVAMTDEVTYLPRSQQKHWQDNYVAIMEGAARHGKGTTAPAQAKKNALAFVLHNGIANVGLSARVSGVEHPLGAAFSGWNVLSCLNPDVFGVPEPETPRRPRRRRKSDEAFADEVAMAQQQRNVRPRLEDDANDLAETGRGARNDGEMPPPPAPLDQDDSFFEMGMDAPPAMDDHHSSSLMPWSRQGSVAPGSSVRGPPGSAQKAPAPSPLLHKSTNVITGLDRHSDPAEPATPSRAALDLPALDDSEMDMDPVLDFGDAAYAGLDVASQQFLDYASKRAVAHGYVAEDAGRRRWIDFEEIANPLKHDGAIAAQAFLHVLSLATRGVVSVRQGSDEKGTQPFGTIHVGINFSAVEE